MSTGAVVGHALVWAGVAVLLLACLGAAVLSDVRDRLHAVSVASVVGAPLATIGLAIGASTWQEATKLLLIGLLLLATAPATSAVTGRTAHRAARRHDGGRPHEAERGPR